jgi:hypothetical protein
MVWMRDAVLRTVKGMDQEQVDFLLDSKANRIDALLLDLAATERLYQLNTFNNVPPKQLGNHPAFQVWAVAMDLGEPARQTIKARSEQLSEPIAGGPREDVRGVP